MQAVKAVGHNIIEPSYYGSDNNDLFEKWYNQAPSFEAFVFAMYTHADKYAFRHLEKNGIIDLEKNQRVIQKLKEYEIRYFELQREKRLENEVKADENK